MTAYKIEKNRVSACPINREHYRAENEKCFHGEVKHPLFLYKGRHWCVVGAHDHVHCKNELKRNFLGKLSSVGFVLTDGF